MSPFKSEPLIKRTANVYLPSEALKNKWNKFAKEKNISLSNLVFLVFTKYMDNDKQIDLKEVLVLKSENRSLKKEDGILNRQVRLMEKLLKQREDQLKKDEIILDEKHLL